MVGHFICAGRSEAGQARSQRKFEREALARVWREGREIPNNNNNNIYFFKVG